MLIGSGLRGASIKEVDAMHIFATPIVTAQCMPSLFFTAEEHNRHYFEKQGAGTFCHVGPAESAYEISRAGGSGA